jgi:hypothetical protein
MANEIGITFSIVLIRQGVKAPAKTAALLFQSGAESSQLKLQKKGSPIGRHRAVDAHGVIYFS